MADDTARIVVELLDKSGVGTAPAGASAPGAGDIPGTEFVGDFHKQITAGGAGRVMGAGSQAPPPPQPIALVPSQQTLEPTAVSQPAAIETPAPVPPVSTQQAPVEWPVPATQEATPVFDLLRNAQQSSLQVSQPQPTGDLSAIKRLLESDPTLTARDIAASNLGFGSQSQIQKLIDEVQGRNQLPKGESPETIPAPPPLAGTIMDGPLGRFFDRDQTQRELEDRFGDTETARIREAQTRMQQRAAEDRERAGKREEEENQPVLATLVAPQRFPKDNTAEELGNLLSNSGASQIARALGGPAAGNATQLIGNALQNSSAIANLFKAMSTPMATPISVAAGTEVVTASVVGPAAGSMASIGPAIAAGAGIAGAALAVPVGAMFSAEMMLRSAEQRIRDIDPRVAVAETQAELRQIYADRRSAALLGDEVADSIRIRSIAAEQRQELTDKLFEPVLEDWNRIKKAFTLATMGVNEGLDATRDSFVGTILGMSPTGQLLKAVESIKERIDTWMDSWLPKQPEPYMYNWFEEQPFKAPPPPFTANDLKAGNRRTVGHAEFEAGGDIPALSPFGDF